MSKAYFSGVLGGLAISLGGTVYLSLDNHLVGSFLFALGLLTIYTFGLSLYTGKLCYVPNKPPAFLVELAVVYIGNLTGTVLSALALRHSKLHKLVDYTRQMVDAKLTDTLPSAFIMAFFCGLCMCIAVIGYQTTKDGVGRHLILVMPVMVFILSGFEHSIANFFYYTLAGAWGMKAVATSAVVTLGNLAGGILLPVAARLLHGQRLGCE